MGKHGQHVAPRGDKWTVRRTGAARASGVFDTQNEAIRRARDIARAERAELYIHGRDGRIRDRSSYEQDAYPPKG